MNLTTKIIHPGDDVTDAQSVRRQVFQLEQKISSQADFDGLDNQLTHIVVYDGDLPVGTTRIKLLENNTLAKIERLTVLSNYRGKHIGQMIMQTVDGFLKKISIKRAVLDSQKYVKGFYEKLGYKQEGEEFEEVGIPHVKMIKEF